MRSVLNVFILVSVNGTFQAKNTPLTVLYPGLPNQSIAVCAFFYCLCLAPKLRRGRERYCRQIEISIWQRQPPVSHRHNYSSQHIEKENSIFWSCELSSKF